MVDTDIPDMSSRFSISNFAFLPTACQGWEGVEIRARHFFQRCSGASGDCSRRSRQDFLVRAMFIALGGLLGTGHRIFHGGRQPAWDRYFRSGWASLALMGAVSRADQRTGQEGRHRHHAATISASSSWWLIRGVLRSRCGTWGCTSRYSCWFSSAALASHEFTGKLVVANGLFLVAFSYLASKGPGLIFLLWPSAFGNQGEWNPH